MPLANSGLIDLLDGATNDVLTIDSDFVGSGGSTLAIDASSLTADLLVITGAASGSTDVDVNFLGGFNPDGVLVVDTGTSTVGAFVLDDVIASPLVDLSLVRIGAGLLPGRRSPTAAAFDPLVIPVFAPTLWYQSADEIFAETRKPATTTGLSFWGEGYGSRDDYGEDNDNVVIDGTRVRGRQ